MSTLNNWPSIKECIKTFEANKGQTIANVKSNYQIEQENKLEVWKKANNQFSQDKPKNVNKSGQYHL